jgi:DNA polymerase/3'-5' exonuclease PolX
MDERIISLPELQEATEGIKSKLDTAGFKAEITGTVRRKWEGGRSGIVVTLATPKEVAALFETKVDPRLPNTSKTIVDDINCYIISTTKEAWGAALLFYTGPFGFKKCICLDAQLQGLKLNYSGVWQGKHRIAGISEEQIFMCLGLDYVEPENRTGYISEMRKEYYDEGHGPRRAKGSVYCYSICYGGKTTRRTPSKAWRTGKSNAISITSRDYGDDDPVVEEA